MIKKNRANLHPEEKIHFKMYKDGKRWVFTGIATFLLSTSVLGGTAMADSTTNAASVDSNISGEQSNGENAVTATTKTSPSIDTTDGEIQRNESSANANDAGSESANTSAASSANVSSAATSTSSTASTKVDSTSSATSTDSTKESSAASSSASVATSSAASSAAESASSAAPASSTASVASSAASETANTSNAASSTTSSAAKPTAKAATFSAMMATAATVQSDSTKIVSVDKMDAKDKALHNLNNAWQGSDYAASIADDAFGLDSITNQYFIDEWMPDKTLQQFIFAQLTSEAGKTITLPDSGKTLTITNGSNGTDIGIADVTEITKKDMQYLLALVSSKITGTTIYDQKAKTLSADELFKNLEGIQYASNLQVLDLRGHDGIAVDMSEVAAVEKNLTYLALYGNDVTGKLDLGNTTSTLSDLYLERTGLTGDLSQMSGMAGLANVSIGNTIDGDSNWTSGMQGIAFPTTASSTTLKALNLRGLGMTGTVPSFIHYTLNNLDISDNKLTGRLPELGALTLGTDANIRFNASNNLFSGTLPTSYLTNTWSEFKVANNLRLTGDVPLWYKINNPGVGLYNVNPNYTHDGIITGAVNQGGSASSDDPYIFNNMTNVIPEGYDISGNYFDGSAIEANYVTSDLPALDQSKLTQKVNKVYDTSNYTIDSDGNLSLNETDLLGAGDVYRYLDGSTYYDGSDATKYVAGPNGTGYAYNYNSDGYTQATSHSFSSTPVVNGTVMATFEDGSTKSFTASDILTLVALQDATTGKNTATPQYKINMKKLFGDNYSNSSKAILSFNLSYDPTHQLYIQQVNSHMVDISASTGTQGSGLNYYANVTLGINATNLGDLSAGQDVSNTYSPIIKNSDGTTTKIGSDIVVSGQTGLDVPTTQLQDITYNGKTYHAKVGSNVVKNGDGSYGLTGTFGETDSRINVEYVAVGNVNVHYKVQHLDGTVTDMPSDASETVDESEHNVGDSVSVTAKTFDGYKIVGSASSSVTLTDADQDVTFTFTNTAEETAAGQTAGKTDGETGKTNNVANKSEDYQAGYKAANDATIKDYSAGQTAGYKDGVNGKTSGTTKPGPEVTDTTAWQNGYAETAKGYPAGKDSYDKDKATGNVDGNTDGLAGKDKADTSSKSQGYQDGYSDGYTTGKAAYDSDYTKGQGLANTDVLAGKTTAVDHTKDSQGLQDGYSKQFSSDLDVQRLGIHNGTQTVLDGKTSDLSGDSIYSGDVKTIYDNAYNSAFTKATSDLNDGKQAALTDVKGKKAEGSSVTTTSSDAFKKGYTDTYSVAQNDFNTGTTDGKMDGLNANTAMKDADRSTATYTDVYDAGYSDGYKTGTAIKDQKDKDIAAGQTDADKDFNNGKTSGDSKKSDGSDDYNNSYDQESKKNESDYAAGTKDAQTDLNNDSKEGTSKKSDQSAAYGEGYTDAWQKGQTANTTGYGDGYNDGFYDTKDKNNHSDDQGDYKHPYQTGYDKGYTEGQAERVANEADIKKGQSDADKDFSKGKTSGDSKDANGSDVYKKSYDDEATKNANDYAAGKSDGEADGKAGKDKSPKENQSDAYNQGYEDGYSTGKTAHDNNSSGTNTGDNGSNNNGNGNSTGTTTDPNSKDDGKVDTNSSDYKDGASAGKSDGESGKPHADNSDKSKDYQAGYDNSYNTSKNQHDTDYVSGQNAGIKDGAAGKSHANNSNKSVGYQTGYDSTYSKAKAVYDKNFKDGKTNGETDKKSGKLHADNSGKPKDYQAGYDAGYDSSEGSMELGTKNAVNGSSAEDNSSLDFTNNSGSDLPQTGEDQNSSTALAVTGLLGLLVALGSFNFKKWFKRE